MDKLIKVRESQFAAYSAFMEAEQEKLREQMIALEHNLVDLKSQYEDNERLISELGLDKTIKGIKVNGNVSVPYSGYSGIIKSYPTPEEYDNKWSWWVKIKYVLRISKRPLSAKEIIEAIYTIQPELKEQSIEIAKRDEINVFSTLSTKGKYLKRKKFGNVSKYSLKDMSNQNGETTDKTKKPAASQATGI